MNIEKTLVEIVDKYKKVLQDNLTGLYLHGSLAMGCFTPKSDIDLIAVVKEPMELKTKRALIDEISTVGPLPAKGLEMSVILEKHAKNIVHPMPFELHYSPAHKQMYEADMDYICGGTTDRDLAAHLAVVKHRGVCLYGKPIEEVFGRIPKSYFIDALIYDIEDAKEAINKDPVYVTLNLCRTLYFLRKGFIGSKLEGGYWCASHLPQEYHGLVTEAVKVCADTQNEMNVAEDELLAFAKYMLEQIYKEMYV